MNGENVTIEDLDATQPMLSTSSPSQIDTGTPLRRISSLSSLTNVSPIDLTQSSPEERVSPEEKRGRFQTSPDRRHSSSLSRLWPRDFSDKNSSGVTNSENVDLDNSNDLENRSASTYIRYCLLEASDTDFVKGWVSDGELALINGFQRCTLFAPDKSTHLLCELHLKKPIDEKLKALGFSTEDRRDICDDIFGKESLDSTSGHRERKLGLIDCKTKTEYLQQLQVTKTLWDTLQKERQSQVLFSEWYDLKQKDKIWNGSGYPMRKKAGLGDPPGKVTNNDSEVMNRHIKDLVSPDGHKLPWHVFIQKLNKVVKSLFDELVSAVTGTGQYRIRCDVRPDLQVSTQQWHSMTWRQKMFRLEPLFLLELPKAQGDISSQNVKENDDFSKANVEIAGISHEKWGEICKKAAIFTHEKLVNQNHMNKNVFGIFDGLDSISVNRTDEYTFICGKPGRQNSIGR